MNWLNYPTFLITQLSTFLVVVNFQHWFSKLQFNQTTQLLLLPVVYLYHSLHLLLVGTMFGIDWKHIGIALANKRVNSKFIFVNHWINRSSNHSGVINFKNYNIFLRLLAATKSLIMPSYSQKLNKICFDHKVSDSKVFCNILYIVHV